MPASPHQRALIAVMAANSRIRRNAGGLLDSHGLSSSQYNVLRILRGAGGELPTMTIRDRMIDPEPSITRLVNRLEERGLVERVPCQDDRRRVDCHLTKDGRALLADLDGLVDAVDRRLMSALDEEELATLADLLDRVAHAEVQPPEEEEA